MSCVTGFICFDLAATDVANISRSLRVDSVDLQNGEGVRVQLSFEVYRITTRTGKHTVNVKAVLQLMYDYTINVFTYHNTHTFVHTKPHTCRLEGSKLMQYQLPRHKLHHLHSLSISHSTCTHCYHSGGQNHCIVESV